MAAFRDGIACRGVRRTEKLKQRAIKKLVKTHGTQPGVLFEFIDEILKDLLPGIHNAHCRADLAEKIRNHLLKYGDSPLPEPAEKNWAKYGVLVALAAIIVTALLWILGQILR